MTATRGRRGAALLRRPSARLALPGGTIEPDNNGDNNRGGWRRTEPDTWTLDQTPAEIETDSGGRGHTVLAGTEKPGVGGSIPPLGTSF
jgi:hypothetical protein